MQDRGIRFAGTRGGRTTFIETICAYSRPIAVYPGQESFAVAKRRNLELLATQLDGTVIEPGEVFSVWRLASRPSSREGYGSAAAIRDGRLTSEVGGAICLLSTVVYNVGLLSGLEIIERHCHSVDTYGDERYFELGRDAAIEFGYLDLRFRNRHAFPVQLAIEVTPTEVSAAVLSREAVDFGVEIAVEMPQHAASAMTVDATRHLLRRDGSVSSDRLPDSVYALPASLAAG